MKKTLGKKVVNSSRQLMDYLVKLGAPIRPIIYFVNTVDIKVANAFFKLLICPTLLQSHHT